MKKNPGMQRNIGGNIKHKNYSVRGWGFSDQSLKWYKEELNKIKNGTIIEVGVYGGASLLSIIDICVKNNITVYGADPWEKTNVVNGVKIAGDDKAFLNKHMIAARKNLEMIIKNLNYTNIKLIQKKSIETSKQFEDNYFDMVYIDGDHSYDSVKTDISAWINKVKPGGFLWGDDYKWESVKAAVNEQFTQIKIINNNWIFKK